MRDEGDAPAAAVLGSTDLHLWGWKNCATRVPNAQRNPAENINYALESNFLDLNERMIATHYAQLQI